MSAQQKTKPVSEAALIRRARQKCRTLEKLVAEGDVEAVCSYWQDNAPFDYSAAALQTAFTCRERMPGMFAALLELGATFSTGNSWALRRADTVPRVQCVFRRGAGRDDAEDAQDASGRLAALDLVCDHKAFAPEELLYQAILRGDEPAVDRLLARGIDLDETHAAMVRGDLGFVNPSKGLPRSMRMELREALWDANVDETAKIIHCFTRCPSVDKIKLYPQDLHREALSKPLMRLMLEKTNLAEIVRRRDLTEAVIARGDAEDLRYLLEHGLLKRRNEIDMLISQLRDVSPNRAEMLSIAMQYANQLPPKRDDALSFDADPMSAKSMRTKWTFKPTEDRSGIRLIRYKGMDTEIVIPERIGRRPVKEVSSGLFTPKRGADCDEIEARRAITSVVVPGSVEELPTGLFWRCRDSLESVTLNEGTRVLGSDLFQGTQISEIRIPDSVQEIGEDCFLNAERLRSIRLPEHLAKIPKRAFAYCENLTRLPEIPSGCRVELEAFRATGIEEVMLRKDLEYGSKVFADCTQLKTAVFPDNMEAVPSSIFSGCRSLETLALPASVRRIGESAFERCANLRRIRIPGECTYMGERAFAGCSGLTHVFVEDGARIGPQAFKDCSSLASVRLPDNLTEIPYEGFKSCSSLTSFTFPPDVKTIGAGAFCQAGLEDVRIPSTVKKIDSAAFQSCENLRSVALCGRQELGDAVFAHCAKLERVDWGPWVYSTGVETFFECKSLAQITLPNMLIDIGRRSFAGSGLQQVRIPASVMYLEEEAFDQCVNLRQIEFAACEQGSRLERIRERCFHECGELQTIVIPEGVKNIDNGAFAASGLRSVVLPSTVQKIWAWAFLDCRYLREVVFLDTAEKSKDRVALEIGVGAFEQCGELESITLPDRTEIIGDAAFQWSGLRSIAIPQYARLGDGIFADCRHLRTARFAEPNPAYVPAEMFRGCERLEFADFAAEIMEVGPGAFAGCRKLGSVPLSSDAVLGAGAFTGCSSHADENGCVEVHGTVFGTAQSAQILRRSDWYGQSPYPPIITDGEDLLPCVLPPKGTAVDSGFVLPEIVYRRSPRDEERPSSAVRLESGNTVLFGKFPREFGGVREPIKWVVLEVDGNEIVLSAQQALFYVPWWRAGARGSRIGQLLETTFRQAAFTESEQSLLRPRMPGEARYFASADRPNTSYVQYPVTPYAKEQQKYYERMNVRADSVSRRNDGLNVWDMPSEYVAPEIRVVLPHRTDE